MVKKISEEEYVDIAREEGRVLVIDFSANWCGPCAMLAPVLEEVSTEMEERVDFYNVDVDADRRLAQKFGVMNIPAVAVVKNGKKLDMQVGFQPKEQLRSYISQYI